MEIKVITGKDFVPITLEITLESQAEVDALFAVGNTSINTRNTITRGASDDTSTIALALVLDPLYRALAPHKT